jgi:site-specific DNA recombinase
MKKAIGYIRISTKDQSNFSLEGQEQLIRDYCEKQSIDLVAFFRDEGQSAKTFDRVNWKLLAEFVAKNHSHVDYLVVSKYDRFSRNVSEALQMMEKLEKKYSIKVMSVMENIGLHPNSPYFFQFRTQMLVGAQVELMVMKDRTRYGIHTANKSGRWVNNAPAGYSWVKADKKNKVQGHLIINPATAPFIKNIFSWFAAGMPAEEIKRKLKGSGLRISGNSSIQWILNNPIYYGMIKVHAYYDEPETTVKGLHQPIIDEATWWKCQALLNENKGRKHVTYNENVPLRGALRCHCYKLLTAGNSRGKSGKYFWYYNCQIHRAPSLNATKLHQQFEALLKELSLPKIHIDYLQGKIIGGIKEAQTDKTNELDATRKLLKGIIQKLESLEDKYLTDSIDKETYFKWRQRLNDERFEYIERIANLELPIGQVWNRYNTLLSQLSDINLIFQNADITGKHAFIRTVFDNKLYYQDGIYRTPYILPLFSSKALLLNEKRLLLLEQPSNFSVNLPLVERPSPLSNPNNTIFDQLQPFLNLLLTLKAA